MPTSSKSLSTFKHFAQLGSRLPRWWLILPTFKFRPEKGVFWGWVGGVLCAYIFPKALYVCSGCSSTWDHVYRIRAALPLSCKCYAVNVMTRRAGLCAGSCCRLILQLPEWSSGPFFSQVHGSLWAAAIYYHLGGLSTASMEINGIFGLNRMKL